ncbi:site-specific DNA-methyltransferase [Hansschlegelia zhihuaiae]|uniref:site-specific DNA-methyltransferase (adenine-specific) n=1 Tax=Hansschlegelia zhihuaiae TaxID=405005 RepID=A0A4Q0M7C6_9HYPH|nr:site-specific DNA-methyltransferase [Hansschlegelia zhihuaiae]RXF68998.1 site-specific DNA-methyltransferase [Hansschlegelia zhihuaiae]
MEKLKMHSSDLTMENIAKVRELFPGCVTEAHDEETGQPRLTVDFDQLRQELSDHALEGPQERYHLNWPGKREALLAANAPIAKTLRPAREESVDFDRTKNLFVEGDNLEALKLLLENYLGLVKLIYIDPPYNTGNDFVYDDDFEDDFATYLIKSGQAEPSRDRMVANPESNGRFHSDWLSMIYSRLRIARSLLHESGFIFVSIDVLELANLISVGKEVFGNDCCIGVISRATGTRMGSGSRGIARELDYIVVFSKNAESSLLGLPMSEEEMALYDQEDEKGRYLTRSLRRTGGENRREDRPTMFFAVQDPDGGDVYPIAPEGYESRWVCSKDTYKKLVREGMIEWKKVTRGGVSKWQVYQKHYLKGGRKEVSDLWNDGAGNKKATKELSALFDRIKVFDHPKPVDLLRRIIQIGTEAKSSDIVMDFFAGSGTTGVAVLEQNAEDGGNRQFILVQFPEEVGDGTEARKAGFSNIAEITKERIRRSGRAIATGPRHADWNGDVGFRTLKIDTSNMQDVYYRPDQVDQKDLLQAVDNIKPDRTPEDLLFQVLVDWGVDLALPIRREVVQGKNVFFVDENALVACFDVGVTEELVKELASREPLRVVFRDNGFVSDAVKINVEQVFRQLSPSTDVRSI